MQARIGAQEHVLSLAQQLLDKEKVRLYICSAVILVVYIRSRRRHTSRAAAARQGEGATIYL